MFSDQNDSATLDDAKALAKALYEITRSVLPDIKWEIKGQTGSYKLRLRKDNLSDLEKIALTPALDVFHEIRLTRAVGPASVGPTYFGVESLWAGRTGEAHRLTLTLGGIEKHSEVMEDINWLAENRERLTAKAQKLFFRYVSQALFTAKNAARPKFRLRTIINNVLKKLPIPGRT